MGATRKIGWKGTADREPLPKSYRSDVRAHCRRTAALPDRSRISCEWVESKKNETELRTYWKYRQIIDEFLNHVGIKADRLLREITPTDIRSWRDALKRKGLAAPTVNDAIKILRMPFKAAHDAGYIEINPCTKNSVRPVKDEARNVEKDVFTPEQLAALIKAATKRRLERCDSVRGLYWLTVARRCRFTVERNRLGRTEDHGNDPQNTQRCHCPDSSAIRLMARETNAWHRQSAGVSNPGR